MITGGLCPDYVWHPFDFVDRMVTGMEHDQHRCRLGMANCWRCQRNYTHALNLLPEPMRSRLLKGFDEIIAGHRAGVS